MVDRTRAPSTLRLAAAALLLVPVLSDCRDPTQITLRLSTDAVCTDVQQTAITVGKLGQIEQKPEAATTDRCDGQSGNIGTLVVVPSGDDDDEIGVRVVTGVGKSAEACVKDGYIGGCIVARRAIRYLPHTPLDLPIFMGVDCLDIPCGATETCFKGKCVPAEIDSEKCKSGNCQPTETDGGAPDAAADAPADQSSGGQGGGGGSGGGAGAAGAGGGGGAGGGSDAGDAVAPCTAPSAECDGNPATVCETDLDSSAQHCGACGHDCLGGSCSAGMCQPTTLWAGLSPTRLALDATHVYFVNYNYGDVYRVPKAGGQAETLATGQKSVRVGVDSSHVYWTNELGNDLLRVPKTGGSPETVLSANTPYGFALAATDVYYAELRAGGTVGVVPKTGGTATPIASGENWPFEVTLTQTHVYWTQLANNADVRRAPLAGGTAETLLSGLTNPAALVADATNLYVAVVGNGNAKGKIIALPLAGGSAVELAVAQPQPRGIAVDATHVYWTNVGAGTIARIAIDGSDNQVPTELASGGTEVLGIAVDDQAVYWADGKGNQVLKLAK